MARPRPTIPQLLRLAADELDRRGLHRGDFRPLARSTEPTECPVCVEGALRAVLDQFGDPLGDSIEPGRFGLLGDTLAAIREHVGVDGVWSWSDGLYVEHERDAEAAGQEAALMLRRIASMVDHPASVSHP